jgi:eukaryotic-like serine/threonine-protein kinase
MEAGQTIAGKYRLNRPLGVGGMASVWSATNVFTDRRFAIKFMLPQVARTPEAARRFLLEAKVSGRINHPNIVEMIDVGQTEDGSLFLVMELLSGLSLEEAIRRREPPMKVYELAVAMRDVAAALAEAHRMGVIHRDLKPTNVFLHSDRGGRTVPKLLDFGVSKVIKDDASEGALTAVGTILGSPFYMSPEQATGADDIDGRTDVFAFGAILFEGLCGERAYDASNLSALLIAIATTSPKDVDSFAPQMPEALRSLVRDCMICDKSKRIASFSQVVDRLDGILPELAKSELVLPPPKTGPAATVEGSRSAGGDIPRRRISDRPPPILSMDVGGSSPPISIPMSAPIFVPERSIRMSAPLPRLGRARRLTRSALGLVAGTAIIVTIAGFVRRGAPLHAVAGIQAKALPAAIAATVPVQSPGVALRQDSSGDVPTVSVDALPVATHAARAKGNGRLTVTAKPGKCWLTIDGVSRGTTPLRALELTAGVHQVDCARPGEKSRAISLAVTEGNDAYYQFVPTE